MALEQVKEYLTQFGIEKSILQFDSSSATVELAAQAVGCAPKRIAKTLSFDVDGKSILVVTAGDTKIDNSKFKAQFHIKANTLRADEVEKRIGHGVGGVCPFAVNEGVKVFLDESLRRFKTVFPACGSSNSAIELTPDDLERYSHSARWIDVCKGWSE